MLKKTLLTLLAVLMHGADVADPVAGAAAVEPAQDQDAAVAHAGESSLGCADPGRLHQVERRRLPGHDVPPVAAVGKLRDREAAVLQANRGLGSSPAQSRGAGVEELLDGC